jgi:hypothetical protein
MSGAHEQGAGTAGAAKLFLELGETELGEPWGVYTYGHVDPGLITLDIVNAVLVDFAFEPVAEAKIEHLYMRCDEPDDGRHWCSGDEQDAVAVTGVAFETT